MGLKVGLLVFICVDSDGMEVDDEPWISGEVGVTVVGAIVELSGRDGEGGLVTCATAALAAELESSPPPPGATTTTTTTITTINKKQHKMPQKNLRRVGFSNTPVKRSVGVAS